MLSSMMASLPPNIFAPLASVLQRSANEGGYRLQSCRSSKGHMWPNASNMPKHWEIKTLELSHGTVPILA